MMKRIAVALVLCVGAVAWGQLSTEDAAKRLEELKHRSQPRSTQPASRASTKLRAPASVPADVVPIYPAVDRTRTPRDIVAFVDAAEGARSRQMARIEAQIAEDLKESRRRPKPGATPYEAARPEDFKKRLADDSDSLRSLRDNSPPYELPLSFPLSLGEIGYWSPSEHFARVQSVLGPKEMTIYVGPETDYNPPVIIKGLSTVGVVDKADLRLPQLFRVSGTKNIGQTVFVLEPIDLKKYLLPTTQPSATR